MMLESYNLTIQVIKFVFDKTFYRVFHTVRYWLGGLGFGEFPQLVGRYSTCLLPRQDSGTSQIQVHTTRVADCMNNPV